MSLSVGAGVCVGVWVFVCVCHILLPASWGNKKAKEIFGKGGGGECHNCTWAAAAKLTSTPTHVHHPELPNHPTTHLTPPNPPDPNRQAVKAFHNQLLLISPT